jgi:hypothetical protein
MRALRQNILRKALKEMDLMEGASFMTRQGQQR